MNINLFNLRYTYIRNEYIHIYTNAILYKEPNLIFVGNKGNCKYSKFIDISFVNTN